jgi:BirA family biotin operon repressor/biotin-[acetyl-CoA-carboxylase] ligase
VERRIQRLASVASTNAVAKELAGAGEPEGTVVLADEQTGGRGRSGRGWYSPPGGGVWASVIVRPGLEARRIAGLGIATAVGLAHALVREFGIDAKVKWPNDILAGGRKLGGILVEAGQVAGDVIESAVVGVGLNVDIEPAAFPEELRVTATSLSTIAGRPIGRGRTLEVVLDAFDETYDRYVKEGAASIRERWRALSTTLGRAIEIAEADRVIAGTVVDLSPEGALVLEDADGRVVEIWHGDVTAIRPA